jgi:hypothetical protein
MVGSRIRGAKRYRIPDPGSGSATLDSWQENCAQRILLQFLERLTRAVDRNEVMDVVFLDFTKAFDKEPHMRLMAQLRAQERRVPTWIGTWLGEKRRHRVVLNRVFSGWDYPVRCATMVCARPYPVPDLHQQHGHHDTSHHNHFKIFRQYRTKLEQVIRPQAKSEQLQSCLDRMAKWADMSAMAFNMSKCKVMHIGAQNPAYEYNMGGTRLGTRRR